ncbi:hypothetical protein [Rothia nasimurium]|uniref:hypothetical protein n=1 Tax=Rothia nasimurium TaxID=85336 RepID=UPI001F27928F|nr:hypothetical protein [Rothia nasimurium]
MELEQLGDSLGDAELVSALALAVAVVAAADAVVWGADAGELADGAATCPWPQAVRHKSSSAVPATLA